MKLLLRCRLESATFTSFAPATEGELASARLWHAQILLLPAVVFDDDANSVQSPNHACGAFKLDKLHFDKQHASLQVRFDES